MILRRLKLIWLAAAWLGVAASAGPCWGGAEAAEAPAAPPPTAVLMPDLGLEPDPASGLSILTWQQVVALRFRQAAKQEGPILLVSCAAMAPSPSDEQVAESAAGDLVGQFPSLRRASTLQAGTRSVQVIEGPRCLLEALAGPLPGQQAKTSASDGADLRIVAPPGWRTRSDATRGSWFAWPTAAPTQQVRIAPAAWQSLAGATADETASETPASDAGELCLPVAFERVELLAPAAGALGREPVALRFLSPAPGDAPTAVDTGAMRLPIPKGWEVVYVEKRLWFAKRTPGEAAAVSQGPGLWPWLPAVRDEKAVQEAAADEGAVAIGCRRGKTSAAVVACPGPSEPVASLLPAVQVILDGLRLAARYDAAEAAPDYQPADNPATGAQPDLLAPDHLRFGDSPQWIALMRAQEDEVLARNRAILRGEEVTDPETDAAAARMEEAVRRLNEEVLSLYPEGGDPSGWMQMRLEQLMQEVLEEEVMGQ